MNIEKKVKKIIHDHLNSPFAIKKEVLSESSIRDDLGADSLDEIELVMQIEDEFDILIQDDESENMKTVEDVIKLVQKMVDIN